MSAAQAQIAVSTAINRIARYRALSQRIAKAYAQMQLAVLPDQATSVMASARKLVRSGFEDLASVPWPADLAQQITEVHKSVDTLEALLVIPPTLQSVAAVAAQGQAVHYGIRPTDLRLADGGIAGQVVVVEPTGAETELLLQLGDARIVMVMHGRTAARPDETLHLALDAEKAHVFDAASGQRLG